MKPSRTIVQKPPGFRFTARAIQRMGALLLFTVCAGCAAASAPPTRFATLTHTSAPEITSTASPSAVPQSSPTPTAADTATATPSPSPSPTPAIPPCTPAGGRIEMGEAPTSRLPVSLVYRVYLPPCYDSSPSHHFPVLYLLHGQYYTDDQWDRLGADETATELILSDQIPPLIIVMPYEIKADPPEESGFGEAVALDLVTWIDQTYRTIPDRTHRALGGLSRGAGWAIHLGFTNWEVFGAIGAHSLPVFWTDSDKLPGRITAIAPDNLPRLYLDIGKKDSDLPSAQEFAAMLDGLNIPHEWHLNTGYHSEDYWQAHMVEYLFWYSQGW